MVDDDSIGDFNWYDSRPPPLAADDTDCMEGDMGGTEDEVCHGEGHLELPPDIMEPDTFANINMIGTGDEVHSHPELPPAARHFCFATANICTLDVAEMKAATHNGHNGGLALSGRSAILEHQFFSSQFDVVGLQESRVQGSVTRMGLHYRMYASSATARGTLGVQCWVRNNTSNFVLYSQSVSPRLMYVVFRFPSRSDSEKAQRAAAAITLAVIVAHAPTSVASLEDKSAFYDSLTRACHELRTKHGDKLRHILLGDFNAKIGPMKASRVGRLALRLKPRAVLCSAILLMSTRSSS